MPRGERVAHDIAGRHPSGAVQVQAFDHPGEGSRQETHRRRRLADRLERQAGRPSIGCVAERRRPVRTGNSSKRPPARALDPSSYRWRPPSKATSLGVIIDRRNLRPRCLTVPTEDRHHPGADAQQSWPPTAIPRTSFTGHHHLRSLNAPPRVAIRLGICVGRSRPTTCEPRVRCSQRHRTRARGRSKTSLAECLRPSAYQGELGRPSASLQANHHRWAVRRLETHPQLPAPTGKLAFASWRSFGRTTPQGTAAVNG